MVAPPDPELPISPIGPDFMHVIWEWAHLTTSLWSLIVAVGVCFGASALALIVGAAFRHFIPHVGKLLQAVMQLGAAAVTISAFFLIGSWTANDSVSPHVMGTHANQVFAWIRSSGNQHITPQDALNLVCEYHQDKSEACGKSIGGVTVSGYEGNGVVLRLDDNGQYRVYDAKSQGVIDL